ncbi:rod shape-determining protein RodA [Candidatus Magnetobacterium casense]|uniref:Peptidoglycan glycosyltransferase RodA n=1 Tax=Candidatus Magnetobacterium casense TaxID=1455061 RepID=A0ABS6RXZ1_9BACT|nr:rod shape-determining protein RodA [Candidatus Magnetobacterium casensis]MBV6341272.1 rod shape-determining protein RodA [Candidatus Magnetobacterium casensis]
MPLPRINRKYLKLFDWYTLLLLLIISLTGVLTVYSATRPILSSLQPNYYLKQLLWIAIGLVCLFAMVLYDYVWLKNFAYVLYIFGLLMLVLVLIVGRSGLGAQRWFDLGIFSFQPSELFRVILIIAIGKYMSSVKGQLTKWTFISSSVIFGLIPFTLIIKQPHLGTGLILLATYFFMALSKKIEKRIVTTLVVAVVLLTPLLGKPIWNNLKDYQKNRIVAFVDPSRDPRGIGYQIEQSKITIGSGMILGRGYLKGTQGPLKFLPEKHTDFIFSVFAEEWGFAGSLVIFSLYLLLFLRGIDTAIKAKDDFASYVAIGITFMLFLYFLINIGMVIGVMPVVGVPIPLMSYGGTSIVTNFLAVGILINIRMRRLVLL